MRDAEAGAALKEVEARGDAPVLQVGLGVMEQVPANADDEDDGEYLKQPRTHTWIAQGQALGCADLILHVMPRRKGR
ncbi:hypothetical protein D3C78_1894980 [compost metagenome]